jgi:organic hydroperoxide reductase OsmC/OhrA
MSQSVSQHDVHVEQVDGFVFDVTFDKPQYETLRLDEPPPLSHDTAPNASRILAAAIGNCLAASLVFCMKRAGLVARGVRAEVHVEIVRNEARRLRIGKISVRLDPGTGNDTQALGGCLEAFEDFCIVTQSVRGGIDVEVEVVKK